MYDEVGEIQLKSLQALQPMFDSEECRGKLEPSISKSKILKFTMNIKFNISF